VRRRKLDAPYRLTPLPCGGGPARLDGSLEPRRSAVLISALATQGGGLDRFWARELRVSQHFSTFYGSSVQAMDTQLNALQTIAKPSWCTVHAPLKVQGSLVYARRGNPRRIT
jgi:hypothetical protein